MKALWEQKTARGARAKKEKMAASAHRSPGSPPLQICVIKSGGWCNCRPRGRKWGSKGFSGSDHLPMEERIVTVAAWHVGADGADRQNQKGKKKPAPPH